MAVRVENTNQINFGTLAGNQSITHARVRRASDDGQPMVKALGTTINAQATNALIINARDIDFVYDNGEFTNAHFRELVDGYWGATGTLGVEVDLMTSSTAVVVDSGYSQQTVNAWTITADAD